MISTKKKYSIDILEIGIVEKNLNCNACFKKFSILCMYMGNMQVMNIDFDLLTSKQIELLNYVNIKNIHKS